MGLVIVLGFVITLCACVVDWSSIGAVVCIVIGVGVVVWGVFVWVVFCIISGSLVVVYGFGV